jgi:hypothetical protein
MRKFTEVVRLHSLGLTQRQIARSCSIAQSTVHEYLKTAAEAALGWPLPPGWNEQELEKALFRKPRLSAKVRQAVPPNFPAVRKQLQTHRNLTLQLLWEEYREGNPEGYSYSRYVAAKNMLRQVLSSLPGLKAGHCRRYISRNLREPYSIGGSPCINCLVPVRPLKLGLMTYRSRTSGTVTYATVRITARVPAP